MTRPLLPWDTPLVDDRPPDRQECYAGCGDPRTAQLRAERRSYGMRSAIGADALIGVRTKIWYFGGMGQK